MTAANRTLDPGVSTKVNSQTHVGGGGGCLCVCVCVCGGGGDRAYRNGGCDCSNFKLTGSRCQYKG